MNDDELQALAAGLVAQLRDTGKQLATAESCTGGWIAKCITDVAGSSDCFAYGIVSYSNGAKEALLGVKTETLAANGAVSEQTVREMAEGALALSGADLAVAVSGIAGPGGGSAEKPVGTVCFGFAVRGRDSETNVMLFDGDRAAVRRQTVAHALKGLQSRLEEYG